jgi:hypothetical protein
MSLWVNQQKNSPFVEFSFEMIMKIEKMFIKYFLFEKKPIIR